MNCNNAELLMMQALREYTYRLAEMRVNICAMLKEVQSWGAEFENASEQLDDVLNGLEETAKDMSEAHHLILTGAAAMRAGQLMNEVTVEITEC